jgi:hypothetical protein
MVKNPDFFVFSSGRSGTTLLASMLNASRQICIPYESDFLARAYPFYCKKKDYSTSDYADLAKVFKKSAKEDGWGMSEDYIVEYLTQKSPQSLGDVFSTICEAYHTLEGTQDLMWGVKSPVLIASLGRISAVYPNAKLIHIVRDGRDVCLSYKNVHKKSQIKFGPKGTISNALYWIDGLRRIEGARSNQFYELRYEDLLNDYKTELIRISKFLGIEYVPSMHEDFNSLDRNKKLAPKVFMQSIHTKLGGGLDPKNAQKFKNDMTKFDLMRFEVLAAPYLKHYRYALVYPFLGLPFFSPVRLLAVYFARFFNDFRYRQRDKKVCNVASQSY